MSEKTKDAVPVEERAPGAIQKGIQMPRHLVLEAVKAKVESGRISDEDADDITWLYDYAKRFSLSYDEAGEKAGISGTVFYHLIHGSYAAQSWTGPVKAIRLFRKVCEEEAKKKNIGFVETETARLIHTACRAAMNDGMPAFIYGASQLGKTTALLEFQRLNNHGRTRYLRLGSRWTKGRLVRELAAMLGNGVREKSLWYLEDAVVNGLDRRNLLIIDEFHLAIETATDEAAKSMVEFLREIYDRTGCGLVISSTKVGLAALEQGKNRLLFDQMARRGVVKVVLPDVPRVKDINAFARAFDLEIPAGETLANIKMLLKSRGLGVFVKYLQKAYAVSREKGKALTWEAFGAVANTYNGLAMMRNEY